MATLQELQADLALVNAALESLIKGERLTQLHLSSADFKQSYTFQELTYENMRELKTELQQAIDDLAAATGGLKFRRQSFMPLRVNKFGDRG